MRYRRWLHLLIPACCWLEEFSCDSVDTFFDQRSQELIEYLTKRGNSRTSLQRNGNCVLSIPHHATLSQPPRLTEHPLLYPSTLRYQKCHLLLIPLSFNPLPTVPTAKKAFPNPPIITYRRDAYVIS